MSGAYQADTGALRQSIEEMKRLPGLAKQMGEDFRSQEKNYTEWPGWTDDFALEVRPRYEENNRYCTDISTALYEVLDALVSATLTNLESIEGTRTDASEQVRAHQAETDEAVFGDGGQGKR
ncbi:hypothetical protein NKH18_17330 [Streptomyces sp. M10(2022)]